jgi:hypothetical protein
VSATAAVAAARAAPLSTKKAWLAALLIDQVADALFAARHGGQGADILVFRAALAEQSEALALVFALAGRELELVTEPVEVPLSDYPTLGVEDFMVSLYNNRTVQRVLIALPDGGRRDVHEVLAGALAALSSQ